MLVSRRTTAAYRSLVGISEGLNEALNRLAAGPQAPRTANGFELYTITVGRPGTAKSVAINRREMRRFARSTVAKNPLIAGFTQVDQVFAENVDHALAPG